VSKEDDDRIKTLTTELQQSLYTIGTNLYQQQGGGGPDGGTPGGGPGASAPGTDGASSGSGDDVIDAEFSETK